jgi:hypothetical protein
LFAPDAWHRCRSARRWLGLRVCSEQPGRPPAGLGFIGDGVIARPYRADLAVSEALRTSGDRLASITHEGIGIMFCDVQLTEPWLPVHVREQCMSFVRIIVIVGIMSVAQSSVAESPSWRFVGVHATPSGNHIQWQWDVNYDDTNAQRTEFTARMRATNVETHEERSWSGVVRCGTQDFRRTDSTGAYLHAAPTEPVYNVWVAGCRDGRAVSVSERFSRLDGDIGAADQVSSAAAQTRSQVAITSGVDGPQPKHAAVLPRILAYADVARSKYQLVPVDDAALADPDTRVKLAFAYAALAKSNEVRIHQMRGATGNKVYVSPDGHDEAVVDEHGKLVTDCVNMASYNYFHENREPLEHFLFDMLPWIESGNCVFDPTSKSERISAYLQDFRIGAIRVFNGPPASLPAGFTFNGKGQAETAALFLRALGETPAPEIARLYTQSATPDDFERFFAQFSRAFARLFE